VGTDGNSEELSEKTDVYGLGNLFYRFIVGRGPWEYAPWRTTEAKITQDDKLRIARVKREEGALPPIPEDRLAKIKADPALYALYKVMMKCYQFDPSDRPSAEELVDYIDLRIKELE
jgi:serine/threonine protein kinase